MQDPFADTRLPTGIASLVSTFVSTATTVPDQLVTGIYITGSIALNDYQRGKSDLDLVVLCRELPTGAALERTRRMHEAIARQHPGTQLNTVYISEKHLDVHHSSRILLFQDQRLKAMDFEMAPVSLLELKTIAMTVYGVPAMQLPVALELSDVNEFLHRNINSYWQDWVRQHSKFIGKKSLLVLVPRLTEWSLLGVARQLYTLRTGKIISKTGAGSYGHEHVFCSRGAQAKQWS